MSIYTSTERVTAPRLLLHRGKFVTAKYNHSSCPPDTNTSWYTSDSEYLPTGFAQKLISNHHFNQQLTVSIPSPKDTFRTFINGCVKAANTAYLIEARLHEILSSQFLKQYFGSDSTVSIYAATPYTSLQYLHNSVCIVKNVLYLYLDKHTYQSLGLKGDDVVETHGAYIVKYKLENLSETNIQRLHWCLEQTPPIKLVVFGTNEKNQHVDLEFTDPVEVLRRLHTNPTQVLSFPHTIEYSAVLESVQTYLETKLESIPRVPVDTKRKARKQLERKQTSAKSADKDNEDEGFMSIEMDDQDRMADDSDVSDGEDLTVLANIDPHQCQKINVKPMLPVSAQVLLQSFTYFATLTQPTSLLSQTLQPSINVRDERTVYQLKVPDNNVLLDTNPFSLLSFTNGSVSSWNLRGMLSVVYIQHVVKHLRKLQVQHNLPWVRMTVHGIDTIVSYSDKLNEPSGGLSGANHSNYTIILCPDNEYIVYTSADGASQIM